MKLDLKKMASGFGMIAGFLAIFGISIASLSNRVKIIWTSPPKINKIDSLEERLDHVYDYMEIDWNFGRSMTDNADSIDWYIFHNEVEYRVDLRKNNDSIPTVFGFVYDLNMPYLIRYDKNEDNQMYIMLHDHVHDKNEETYLYTPSRY
jgi:hypothetical protein